MSKNKTLRDRLRGKTLGAKKNFKFEIVVIDGEEFEVRQPTLKQRSDLRKRCATMEGSKFEFDIFEFLTWAVIECTFVPGTDDKVFEASDYDMLGSIPAGGWFDDLSEKASELANVKKDDVKKISEPTKIDSES
jgi:hypothetical protein